MQKPRFEMTARRTRTSLAGKRAARVRARNRITHLALASLLLPVAAFLAWAIVHCLANPPAAMPPQQFVASLGMLGTMGVAALALGLANVWEARA